MFSRQSRKSRFLFALGDILLIALAFALAYATRQSLSLSRLFFLPTPTVTFLVLYSVAAWLISGRISGVHDHLLDGQWFRTGLRTLQQATIAGISIILLEYVLRMDLSRLFLGLFLLYAAALLLTARLTISYFRDRLLRLLSQSHVLIAGTGDAALRIGRLVEENSQFGLRLLGFLGDEPGTVTLTEPRPVFHWDTLHQLLKTRVIDEIIFAVDSNRLRDLEEALLLCDEEGVRTRVSVDYFPHVNSSVYLDRLGTAQLLTFSAVPHDELRLMVKRATDVVLAGVALIVLSPLMLVILALIRLTSAGPAIFFQERCGLNGRRFRCYKFRTMVADAEARQAELAHLNVKTTAFKIPDDPRVTPLGRWLRKFSIDEWPQLWNVVKGEMAIVGPRPPVPGEVEHYERWQRRRLRMRPGLTCLWTLAGRDRLPFDEWMKLDLTYIDTWSLALDWSIMLRTIPHVITGRGAH